MADARRVAAYSTLASGIDSDDTSISVASGHGTRFPSTGSWLAFVYDSIFPNFAVAYQNGYGEAMQITSRSTDTLTVGTRAFVDPQSKGAKSFNTTGRTYRIEMNVQDASATESGDVNLTTQSLSGLKIFTDHAAVGEEAVTTGQLRLYTADGTEYGTITATSPLDSNHTWTLPNKAGTVAMTDDVKQILTHGITGDVNATRYFVFGSDALTATDVVRVVVPTGVSLTLSNLTVRVATTAVNGQTTAVTLMKDGVATTLVATVTNADKTVASTAEDTTHTVALVAGDTFSFSVVPAGTSNGIGIGCKLLIS